MVNYSFTLSRRVFAWFDPYLVPALRRGGWFTVFLIMAPAIGPHGYGLFVSALGGVAIVEALLAETATHVLAEFPAPEDRHWSTALISLMAAGAGLWLILCTATGPVSALFGEPALSDLLPSLAMLPLLGGLAAVPRAALHRAGREPVLRAASSTGFVAASGIAVSLAWVGAGPWSLVALTVVQRLVECAVLWGLSGNSVGIAWSRRHFAELVGAMDLSSFAAAWPAVTLYGPSLIVALVLGPTAAGLYLLAARLAQMLTDIVLANDARETPRQPARRAWQAVFPAVLTSMLLAVALPPLLNLLWWGAVMPAQILMLGAIPNAVGTVRGAVNRAHEPSWQAMQTLGLIAFVAFAAPHGLAAMAWTSVGWTTVVALASLWPLRRRFGSDWLVAAREAARPCGGAALAGLLVFVLADPVSTALAPVPALCLLTACGWLVYLIVRGDAPEDGATTVLVGAPRMS